MTTPPTLQAIKERDARRGELAPQPSIRGAADDAIRGDSDQQAQRDRRHLLDLVERMRPYVVRASHPFDCSASQGSPRDCTCGLDALLKELST